MESKLENKDRELKQLRSEVRDLKESKLQVDSLADSLSKLKSVHLKTVSAYRKKLEMMKSKFQTFYKPNKESGNKSNLKEKKDEKKTNPNNSLLESLFRLCSHCGKKMETGNLKSPKFDIFKTIKEKGLLEVDSSDSESEEEESEEYKVSLVTYYVSYIYLVIPKGIYLSIL